MEEVHEHRVVCTLLQTLYLVNSCEVTEEALGAAEQSLVVRTNHQVPDVPLGAEGIQQQFLPVGQTEGRQHHKVVLITHQEGGNGQRLWGLVCACGRKEERGGERGETRAETGVLLTGKVSATLPPSSTLCCASECEVTRRCDSSSQQS